MASQNRTHASDRGKAVVDIPGIPTIGTATPGGASAIVAFTANVRGGAATTWTALSSPGSITGTGSSSPVTVTGLTPGTSYTFTVRGTNSTGTGEYSAASNSVVPEVPNSYESIATVTVGAGGQSGITFSSIPSTYKHLQLRFMARVTGATTLDNLTMRFNNTAGTAYATHFLQGNGSTSTGSFVTTSGSELYVGRLTGANSTSGMFGVGVIDILDYQNTNKNKTVRTLSGQDQNGSGEVYFWSGLFNSTSAVNEINLLNSYAQHSSFALYGIKG